MQHHDTHEDRLLDLLAGAPGPAAERDRALRSAFEASELARCTTCAELFEDYLRLEDALGRTGGELRKAEHLAESVRWQRGDDLVEDVLRPLAEGAETAPPAKPRVPWLAVAGAVVAAALLIQFFLYDPFATAAETYGAPTLGGSGGHGLEVLHPAGPVALWTSFAWKGELPPGGWYTVRVGNREGELLAESDPLRTPRWQPAIEELLTWPDHLQWEVWLYDSSGKHLDTAFGEAWLSSR